MNLWQAFKMAFKSISMKKTRSFLTMLGIIIGVASVVIMVSVVQGQNKKSMEYFEKMGDNKINVSAYSWYDTNNETSQKLYDYCLSMNDLVLGITPNVEIGQKMTIQYGAKTLAVNDWEGMGWGGTDFHCVFDYANEFSRQNRGKKLKGLFFFSDAMGPFPSEKPKYRTTFFVPAENDFIDYDSFCYVPDWVELVKYKD